MHPRITSPRAAAGALLLIVTIAVLLPGTFLVAGAAMGGGGLEWRDIIPRGPLLLRTVVTALVIGVLATALALPAAWLARTWRTGMLLLLLAPLLLPSYLAYSGWGLLRAPGTMLGDLLIRGPTGDPGANWWPLAASRVQAFVGLVLWSWPLAAAILVARFRRLDDDLLKAIRLDTSGPVGRAGAVLAMTWRSVLAACGIVAMVMLGSAVPLHVAQFETYAIELWRRISETPHAEHWRIWIASWPLLAVAAFGAVLITRRIASAEAGRPDVGNHRSTVAAVYTVALWALSVVAPAILFAISLRSAGSLTRFWEQSWQPLVASLGIAVCVGGAGFLLLVCTWHAASARELHPFVARLAVISAGVLLFSGLVPGILVGAATARAWLLLGEQIPAARHIADSTAIVVIAHIARFGFIPALAGLFLAATEPRDMRALRLLDSGPSLCGFVRAALLPQIGVALGISIITGLLSFHEIEAAVLLQPPSAVGGGMPWQLLQWLHFARSEHLGAAVLWILVLGVGALALAALAGRLGRSRARW